MKRLILLIISALAMLGCVRVISSISHGDPAPGAGTYNADHKSQAPKLKRSNAEWRKVLTPNQYGILRNAATEPAFRNAFWDNHKSGVYSCAACGQKLFSTKTKFDSGTGWPSFWAPISKGAVLYRHDTSDGMDRIEVLCSNCGGHLGHLFDDGPKPTSQRFCMNSGAMKFTPAGK